MAVYAVQILSKVGIKARQIGSAENYLDEVAGMDRSGLVLALGFSRYHKGTVSLLGMLKKNGFNIVAITDYPMSPLARVANYSFSLARSSHDYTISFLNVNMLLNVLAIYIGMQDKDALLNRLRQYDENAQGLEYYF
jgi:DNA-binding MurR/RpiR family transcriptional regulator